MKIKTASKGFTMVELLIVVGIIVVLFGGIMISSYIFRNQLSFSTAVNSLKSIADEAKNSALSTLSYPEGSLDIDGDGRTCAESIDPKSPECDKILPNGYILSFDSSGDTVKVSLYADLMSSKVNVLDTENDILIRSMELSEDVDISAQSSSSAGTVSDLSDIFSVIYTSGNTEFYVLGETPEDEATKDSFQIHLTQFDSQGTVTRDKYIYIQNLNNTAQITDSRMIRASS